MTDLVLADLRTIGLFDDSSDAELGEWIAVAETRVVEAGGLLAGADRELPEVLLLFEGTARNYLVERGREEPLGRQAAPTWSGAIAALTETPFGLTIRADVRCRLAAIAGDDFRRLALAQPPVHRRVMQRVAPVLGRMTAREQNRERLASLGTMAAGLAHELGNPAAAARRSASVLAETLPIVNASFRSFVESGVERAQAETLIALHAEALERAGARQPLDTLDAADGEEELADRLRGAGVADPWSLAEPLAAAGLDADWLDRVGAAAGPATDAALQWVAATLSARGLVEELQESTQRMASLVGAIKGYSYMDRGDVVEVDLHEGLETTLVILGHKLKKASIGVVRDYDRSLPRLTVRASELNQVWTNLIANAIDAVVEGGTITIATRRDGDCALVDITDDGSGIPEAIQDRIFETFFTTKEVGSGTGLGLETARRIVVDRHDGSLTFESRPGATTFHVWIPYPTPVT